MQTVYDIDLELQTNVSNVDLARLRDHFKALSIETVGLDGMNPRLGTCNLEFSIYGNVGPFMMKQMVEECTRNIFPGSVIGFSNCR